MPTGSTRVATLVLTEDEFRRAVDTAIDGLVVIDSSGPVPLRNPACERIFGHAEDEVPGNNVDMPRPSPDRENHDRREPPPAKRNHGREGTFRRTHDMIDRLKFPSAYTILFGLIVVVAIATWVVPAGQYERRLSDAPGKEVPVSGSCPRPRVSPS